MPHLLAYGLIFEFNVYFFIEEGMHVLDLGYRQLELITTRLPRLRQLKMPVVVHRR